ncbi:hypothetical protein EW146_g5634 [Bondarzewia mesenterica]|uniref:Uncharacterized protein n=1 Tax=Bondarzewia mesenterica TaxID=1095465 RepID=A0A4S4LQV8_9AGAM|nr:hypothetical protein EW146_g5634 [Bondarzewia mesenterica]
MELGYDSLIFLLTLARTTYMHWTRQGTGPGTRTLVDKLIRDGAAYFAVIFSMNLAWVVMIMYAPTGLRAIASVPSACVTTVMITRITLNLRTTVYGPAQLDDRTYHHHHHHHHRGDHDYNYNYDNSPNAIPLSPLGNGNGKRATGKGRGRRFGSTATEDWTGRGRGRRFGSTATEDWTERVRAEVEWNDDDDDDARESVGRGWEGEEARRRDGGGMGLGFGRAATPVFGRHEGVVGLNLDGKDDGGGVGTS